jgi:hypothetical protein
VGVNLADETVAGRRSEMKTAAFMAESRLTLGGAHTLFGRGELFGMPAHHLHAYELGEGIFTMGKLQLGYVRHLSAVKGLVAGVGATGSLSLLPPAFAPRYGGRVAPGVGVFLNIQPARHAM